MSQAVPTFSSFPDLDSKEDSKHKRDHKSRKERHRDRDEKSSRRKHSRSRSKSPERSSKRRKHESRKEEKRPRPEILDDEKVHSKQRRERSTSEGGGGSSHSRNFYVDKRGDMGNITYGSLHQGDVPKFHRAGRGKVLGLSSIWNIQRGSGNKQVEIGRRDRRKVARYTDSKFLTQFMEGPRRLLAIPATPAPASGEFIALSKRKKRGDDDVHDSYRSIERKLSHDSDSDISGSRESFSDSDSEHILTAEQHSIKALERTLASSPDDITSWLRLLDLSVKSLSTLTKRTSRARAEISISLLRRAIDAHPDNITSIRLRLLYIEHGSKIWSDATVREEWERLLGFLGAPQAPPWKRAVIWLNWLDWRLAASPTVTSALNDVKRVFALLHGELFERVRARLCWRIAIFLREAGFLEQGFAILQAQVEMSHFYPENLLSQPFGSKTEAFETFWEAEVPRIGEADAKGWAAWEECGRPDADDTGGKRLPSKVDIQDPYQHWFCLEKALDIVGVSPTRSFNEDQQDPYGTILFTDIHPFLSDIRSPRAKEYLRLAFLSFLGLNIPGVAGIPVLDDPEHLGFLSDGWMLSGLGGWVSNPEILFPSTKQERLITWESHVGTTIGLERPKQSAFGPVKEWVHTRSLLEGVSISGQSRAWESVDVYNVQVDCVRQTFGQLKEVVQLQQWNDMRTAFDAAVDIKSALKSSKQRLEVDRSSLYLWRKHARLERIRDKQVEASKVYAMAVALDLQSPEMPQLVADAVEFFWLRDDKSEAQQILSRFLDIQGPLTGLNLLRARKNLEGHKSSQGVHGPQWEACIRIGFFLELAASTVQESIATFDTCLIALDISMQLRESLTVWLCITLSSISKLPGSLIPPAVVSTRVNAALEVYRNNTVLLGLFLECERGLGIWGRVRGLLDENSSVGSSLLAPRGLKLIAWDIWAEDWGYGPWEPERVRMKLERAVNSKSMGGSVVLWQICLAFEMRVNNFERAKAILFRALGHCPWAKELYMMAFGPLRAAFRHTELNDLVSAMVERGLRMRRDVEEFLDGWEGPGMMLDAADDGNAGDAELETLIHDREQAKPY